MLVTGNRYVTIKLNFDDGSTFRTQRISMNFASFKTFEEFNKNLSIGLRLSASDPDFEIIERKTKLSNSATVELDQSWLDAFKASLNQINGHKRDNLVVEVVVKRPPNTEDQENKTNNVRNSARSESRMKSFVSCETNSGRSKTPISTSRSKTPNKDGPKTPGVRSKTPSGLSSRGGPAPSPAHNFRTVSADLNNNAQPEMSKPQIVRTTVRPLTSLMSPSLKSATKELPQRPQLSAVYNDANTDVVSEPVLSAVEKVPVTPVAVKSSTAAPKSSVKKQKSSEIREIIESTFTDKLSPVRDRSAEAHAAPTLDSFSYVSDEEDEEEDSEDEEAEDDEQLREQQQATVEELEIQQQQQATEEVASSSAEQAHSLDPLASTGVSTTSSKTNPMDHLASPRKKATPIFSSAKKVVPQPKIDQKGSIYTHGDTAAEVKVKMESSLRQGEKTSGKNKSSSTRKKAAAGKVESLEFNPRSSGKSSSMFGGEGRPSIGTMTSQWEFMRTNFVNNSDEELEWLMVSKQAGAYKHAHRKNCLAEDNYFHAMHDMERLGAAMKYFVGPSAKLPNFIAEMAAQSKNIKVSQRNPAAEEKLMVEHAALKKYLQDQQEADILSYFEPGTARAIQSLLDETELVAIARKVHDLHFQSKSNADPGPVPLGCKAMPMKLAKATRESDDSLCSMEKWARREKETDDYQLEMAREEAIWMEKEYAANEQALEAMRRFVPVNIADMSVKDIMDQAVEEGGLLTLELATEIKNNRFLHWLVTHKDDIAMSNFLSGDKKAYFENLESYDVQELRALVQCIPLRFELDADNKKAEWRSRLMARAKQLVSQVNGDKVKGSWDDKIKARQMVQLPPLKPDQMRRPIYFYRTKEQSDLRLKQYDTKNALLAKKEATLTAAEAKAVDAKAEYEIVLRESRDPDFIEQYGADRLAEGKDLAKKEWNDAERHRKTATQEVMQLRQTIASAPLTRDQFAKMEDDLREFLETAGHPWTEPKQAPKEIMGVFDAHPEILKTERQAAKFTTAEEEAEQRKAELNRLKNTKQEEVAEILEAEATITIKSELTSVGSCSNLSAKYEASLSSENSEKLQAQTPRAAGKRNSVLLANPDLLNTLNRMFSSPAASSAVGSMTGPSAIKAANRRASLATNLFPETDAAAPSEPATPKVKTVKKTQSKLLKRILDPMGGVSPKRGVSEGGAAAPLSFLEQIKAKKSGGAAPGLSFLDQLKGGFGKKEPKPASDESGDAAPRPPMSFLDQIRGARKTPAPEASSAEEKTTATTADDLPEAPVAKKAKPMMSFLDSIKSRRID